MIQTKQPSLNRSSVVRLFVPTGRSYFLPSSWLGLVCPGLLAAFLASITFATAQIIPLSADQDAHGTSYGTFDDPELDVGYRDFGTVYENRVAIRCPLPAMLEPSRIQSASLRLYYFDAWGSFNNRSVHAHRMSENWSEIGPLFGAQRDTAYTEATVGGTDFGWISWDVTAAARLWAANPATNFGIMLVAAPGGLSDNAFRFYSTESANEPYRPVLEITYQSPPQLGGAVTKLLPFQGRLTDVSGKPVADGERVVQFRIFDAPLGGNAVWNGEVQTLTVNEGIASTTLGTKASLSTVDFNKSLFLELTIDVNGDGQITMADPPLLPRYGIFAAVFAKETVESRNLSGYDWTPLFGANDPLTNPIAETKLPRGVPIPIGGVIVWWGGTDQIPPGFEICDGNEPTTPRALLQGNKPDLRDRFVKGGDSGAVDVSSPPVSGGTNTITSRNSGDANLAPAQLPAHPHPVNLTTSVDGNHSHLLPIVQNGNQGTYGINAALIFGQPIGGGFSGAHARTTDVQGDHPHSVVGDTGLTGAALAHNHTIPAHDNRPDFLEMFFIIRVK